MEAKVAGDDVVIHKTCRGDLRIRTDQDRLELGDETINLGTTPIIRENTVFFPATFYENVLGLDIHGGGDEDLYISRVVSITDITPEGVGLEYKYERSYTNFELDDGESIRLVVDLDAAIVRDGAVEKSQVAESFPNFRLAQFNNKPDIVRVVLELKKKDGLPPEYRIERQPGGLWIGLGPDPFKIEMEQASEDGCSAIINTGRYSELKEYFNPQPGSGTLTLEFLGAQFPAKDETVAGVGLISRARIIDTSGSVKVTIDLLGASEYSIEQLPGRKLRVNFSGSPGNLKGRVIVIDPGHGGRDPGAVRGSVREKDLNLEMSRFLADGLRKMGATVYMTRNSDVYLRLEDRLNHAKRHGADLLVVVHTNASRQPETEIHGPMLIFDGDCDYRDLLKLVYEEMVRHGGRDGIGPRLDDRGLYLLRYRSNLPVLFIETAFMNNPKDLSLLTQPEGSFKRNLMHGVALGILRYYTGNYKPSPLPPAEPLGIDPRLFGLIDEEGLFED
jgi:N-acetylmuramoyl-L-alanine amidase